jgi:DNA-binding PadR family transcriptional regulator
MPGRRGRGRGRRAVRMLEPALLLFLHHGPAHGYTFLDQLGEFGLGDVNPSVVYRALRDMEARGWVTSTWDDEQTHGPPRRVYQITALGDEVLSLWAQDLQESRRRIDHLLSVYRRHMEEGEGNHH